MNVMVGNLFYGTGGLGRDERQGFQAFKGESNELIMEEHAASVDLGTTVPLCTCRTSWRLAVRGITRTCTMRSGTRT